MGHETSDDRRQFTTRFPLGPGRPFAAVEQREGETTRVQLHDGSWITLRALRHNEHRVTDRASAMRLLVESQDRGEFLTGLLYVNTDRPDFLDTCRQAGFTLVAPAEFATRDLRGVANAA